MISKMEKKIRALRTLFILPKMLFRMVMVVLIIYLTGVYVEKSIMVTIMGICGMVYILDYMLKTIIKITYEQK